MPSQSFLNPFWTDLLAALGVAGVLLTLVGLAVAWAQLRRTAKAAVAARDAARAAESQARESVAGFVLGDLRRLLQEAKIYAGSGEWALAAVRLDDVASAAAQLRHATDAGEWVESGRRLRDSAGTFRRLAAGQIEVTAHARNKWERLARDVVTAIDSRHGPFSRVHQPAGGSPAAGDGT